MRASITFGIRAARTAASSNARLASSMRPRRSAQVRTNRPPRSAPARANRASTVQKRLPFRAGRGRPGSRARSWKPAPPATESAGRPPVRKGGGPRAAFDPLKHFPRLRHVSGVRVDFAPRLWSRSGCCRRRQGADPQTPSLGGRVGPRLRAHPPGKYRMAISYSPKYSVMSIPSSRPIRIIVCWSSIAPATSCRAIRMASAVSHGRDQVESVAALLAELDGPCADTFRVVEAPHSSEDRFQQHQRDDQRLVRLVSDRVGQANGFLERRGSLRPPILANQRTAGARISRARNALDAVLASSTAASATIALDRANSDTQSKRSGSVEDDFRFPPSSRRLAAQTHAPSRNRRARILVTADR